MLSDTVEPVGASDAPLGAGTPTAAITPLMRPTRAVRYRRSIAADYRRARGEHRGDETSPRTLTS